MSVDGSNFQADMDALRLYYDALCEHSKHNSWFDSSTYTYKYFQSEFFHLWASQIITIIGSMKLLNTPKYLDKQCKKDNTGKGETLTFATLKAYERILKRVVTYYENGVIDKIANPGVTLKVA